ncbi:hypothetical protein J2Y58_001586 [Sphingomonas sp. BE138]|nr:hypothetical protein [Sphingomonas sp. BE138]
MAEAAENSALAMTKQPPTDSPFGNPSYDHRRA